MATDGLPAPEQRRPGNPAQARPQLSHPLELSSGQCRVPHSLVKSCWMRGKALPGPPRRILPMNQVRPTTMTRATMRRGPGGAGQTGGSPPQTRRHSTVAFHSQASSATREEGTTGPQGVWLGGSARPSSDKPGAPRPLEDSSWFCEVS